MAIQLKRGLKANLPSSGDVQGRPLYTTDTNELYIANGIGSPKTKITTEIAVNGDGVTDDSAIINNAISAASLAGGGTIKLPGGKVCKCNSTIMLRSNVILDLNNSTLKSGTTAPLVSNNVSGSCVQRAGLINGKLDGQSSSILLDLHSVQYSQFRNLLLRTAVDTSTGISLKADVATFTANQPWERNTVFNIFESFNQEGPGFKYGLVLQGTNSGGFSAVTNNTFVGPFALFANTVGYRFLENCDSNVFTGWHTATLTSNDASGACMVFNDTATPSVECDVWGLVFENFTCQSWYNASSNYGKKGVVLNKCGGITIGNLGEDRPVFSDNSSATFWGDSSPYIVVDNYADSYHIVAAHGSPFNALRVHSKNVNGLVTNFKNLDYYDAANSSTSTPSSGTTISNGGPGVKTRNAFWSAPASALPASLVVDMIEAIDLEYISFDAHWREDTSRIPKTYNICSSTDGINWSAPFVNVINQAPASAVGHVLTPAVTGARYIKLTITAANSKDPIICNLHIMSKSHSNRGDGALLANADMNITGKFNQGYNLKATDPNLQTANIVTIADNGNYSGLTSTGVRQTFGQWIVAATPKVANPYTWGAICAEWNPFNRYADQGYNDTRTGNFTVGHQMVPEGGLFNFNADTTIGWNHFYGYSSPKWERGYNADIGTFYGSSTGDNTGSNPLTNIYWSGISAAGSGYSVNDVLTVSGGTGGTVKVTSIGPSGTVTTIQGITSGSGYSAGVFSVSGGTGTGCTIQVQIQFPAAKWHNAILVETNATTPVGVSILLKGGSDGNNAPVSSLKIKGYQNNALDLSESTIPASGSAIKLGSTHYITDGTIKKTLAQLSGSSNVSYYASTAQELTNLISVVTSAGGGKIILGAGTFTCPSQVVGWDFSGTNNVTIEGAGQGVTILKWPNHFATAAKSNFWQVTDYLFRVGSNFTMRNLTIDGNKANQSYGTTNEGCNGLVIKGNNHVLLENIEIANTNYLGMNIMANGVPYTNTNGTGFITLRNCYIHDMYNAVSPQFPGGFDLNNHIYGAGIIFNGSTGQHDASSQLAEVLIEGSEIRNCGWDGINGWGFDKLKLINNKFINNGMNCDVVFGFGACGVYINDVYTVQAIGNTAIGNTEAGISISKYNNGGCKDVIISGNYIKNNNLGMEIIGLINSRVSDNILIDNWMGLSYYDNIDGALSINASVDTVIENNTIIDSRSGASRQHYAIFDGTTYPGYYAANTNLTIRNNIIKNFRQTFYNVDYSTNNQVDGVSIAQAATSIHGGTF